MWDVVVEDEALVWRPPEDPFLDASPTSKGGKGGAVVAWGEPPPGQGGWGADEWGGKGKGKGWDDPFGKGGGKPAAHFALANDPWGGVKGGDEWGKGKGGGWGGDEWGKGKGGWGG